MSSAIATKTTPAAEYTEYCLQSLSVLHQSGEGATVMLHELLGNVCKADTSVIPVVFDSTFYSHSSVEAVYRPNWLSLPEKKTFEDLIDGEGNLKPLEPMLFTGHYNLLSTWLKVVMREFNRRCEATHADYPTIIVAIDNLIEVFNVLSDSKHSQYIRHSLNTLLLMGRRYKMHLWSVLGTSTSATAVPFSNVALAQSHIILSPSLGNSARTMQWLPRHIDSDVIEASLSSANDPINDRVWATSFNDGKATWSSETDTDTGILPLATYNWDWANRMVNLINSYRYDR